MRSNAVALIKACNPSATRWSDRAIHPWINGRYALKRHSTRLKKIRASGVRRIPNSAQISVTKCCCHVNSHSQRARFGSEIVSSLLKMFSSLSIRLRNDPRRVHGPRYLRLARNSQPWIRPTVIPASKSCRPINDAGANFGLSETWLHDAFDHPHLELSASLRPVVIRHRGVGVGRVARVRLTGRIDGAIFPLF